MAPGAVARVVPPDKPMEGFLADQHALIVRAETSIDLHGSEVLAQLEDQHGHRATYGFQPALARQLGQRLMAQADEAEKVAAGIMITRA